MEARLKRLTSLAALTLAGSALFSTAQAQTSVYTFTDVAGSQHDYALLNGRDIALYINDRGDLGAPYRIDTTPEKPFGIQGNGKAPFVNPDGSIDTTKTGTYGALFNVAQNGNTSILAKTEYLTVGTGSVAEGFSITGKGLPTSLADPRNWLHGNDIDIFPTFSDKKGAAATDTLSISSNLVLPIDVQGNLQIKQTVSFQNPGDPLNRAKISITFTNTSATDITDFQYARAIDPNPAGTLGTGETNQSFRTPADPTAFAIDAFSGDRHLAFGVYPGDPNTIGTQLLATGQTNEDSLLNRPDIQLQSGFHVRLGAGTEADYLDAAGNVLASTADYLTDPFKDSHGNIVDVAFSPAAGNAALMLLSPTFDIAANGGFQTFTYFMFFDPPKRPSTVPEPGAMAFLLGGLAFGGSLIARRRRQR